MEFKINVSRDNLYIAVIMFMAGFKDNEAMGNFKY